MTTKELRANVFENLNLWLDDKDALSQINDFLLNMKERLHGMCACEEAVPYSMKELNARIDDSETQINNGEAYLHDDVMNEMRNYLTEQ